MREAITLPADVCLNFSLFFFLHFQGLKILPRLANLLLLRMGGVCVPGTRESERMAASLSTSSAVFPPRKRWKERGRKKVLKMGSSQMADVFHGYRSQKPHDRSSISLFCLLEWKSHQCVLQPGDSQPNPTDLEHPTCTQPST